MTDTPLTDQQLDDIEARTAAATDGPWFVHDDWPGRVFAESEFNAHVARVTGSNPEANEQFIAHAREDVPALLAEIRRQRAELADAEAEKAKLIRWHGEDETALAKMRGTIERLRGELAKEQRLHGDTIDCRDRAQDLADKLAYAVAAEEVIGEHTADNCPWQNALDLITPKAEVDKLRQQLAAVAHLCDAAERQAARWEQPLPVPEWVAAVRNALDASVRPVPAPEAPEGRTTLETAAHGHTGGPTGTLAAWLRHRFTASGVPWERLDDGEQSYWEHHAAAVRRAVKRGGFKTTPAAVPAAVESE